MTASLVRSLLANWVGLFIAGLVGLILSPILVRNLGKETYGAWTLVVSATAQLALLDFGIRNSLVAFVARARSQKDSLNLSKTLSTALCLLTAAGVAAFGVSILSLPYIQYVFAVDPHLLEIFKILLVIYALDSGIELACGVFNGALAGSERYDIMNLVTSLRVTCNAVLVVIGLQLGCSVLEVALIALVTRVAQRVAFGFCAFATNPQVKVRYTLWDTATAKEILRYGTWAFFIVLATRVIYQADVIVVGIFLGPNSVALYAIAVILVDQLRMMLQTANSILTPRLSALEAEAKCDVQLKLLEKWSFLSTLLAVCVGIPLCLNGEAFIDLWIGHDFLESGYILMLLVIPYFFTAPSLALSSYLFATSQHSLSARIQMIEAACNLTLSVTCVHFFGIRGAAWGTIIPAIIFTGLMLPYFTCQRLKVPFLHFLLKTIVKAVPPSIVYAAVLILFSKLNDVSSWVGFILANAIPALLFGCLVFFHYLDHEDRKYIFRRFGRS